MHLAAALDHQPLHAALAEVLADRAHLDRLPAVDHGRHRPEARAGVGHPRARAVDELLGVAGGEEVGAGVELHALGHGDLDRRRREPSGRPLVAAGLRAHEQPRVVVPHGACAHEDRVAGGAHGVDPVEVGVVGQREALRHRAAEIAVDRHAAAQQRVRALRHRALRPAASAGTRHVSGGSGCSSAGVRRSHASRRKMAPGRLATNTMTPYTTAVATP